MLTCKPFTEAERTTEDWDSRIRQLCFVARSVLPACQDFVFLDLLGATQTSICGPPTTCDCTLHDPSPPWW